MLPLRRPSDTTTPAGRRILHVATLLLVLMVVAAAVVVVSNAAAAATRRPSGLALMASDQHQIDAETQKAELGSRRRRWWRLFSGSGRRELIGSAPPTCRYRCGRCSPCQAVHVPIQPGWSRPLEYYPEAWRCRCGNNLFMP